MLRVCKDTYVGQTDCVCHGSHAGFVLRTEETGGGGTRGSRRACEGGLLICEHCGGGRGLVGSGVVQAFRRTSGGTSGTKDV